MIMACLLESVRSPVRLQHTVDVEHGKNFDTKYPDFAKEPRNVRLGLAADGFNPFGNLSQAYSMWPVILTTYNLPPWLCMKESSFMLTLLIPGPKSQARTLILPTRVEGINIRRHGEVKIKRNVHGELNWTRTAILNTLLMNDKSKDTAKARQDLQMLGIRSGLWLGQTKNGKCLKPQAASRCRSLCELELICPPAPSLTYGSLEVVAGIYPPVDIRQRHVDNDQDPEVSTTSELIPLDNGLIMDSILTKLLRSRTSSSDVAIGPTDGEGGGDDCPPYHTFVPTCFCGGCLWLTKILQAKADPTTGTYDVEAIRRARPEEITAAEWDKYIKFWNDPKNLARAAQNRLNRQKSEERKRLEATGEYTNDEINALAIGGKLRGHIPGVGRREWRGVVDDEESGVLMRLNDGER
ncbi:transposon ty3-I gag-pol polyprotein [Tanacetum coccineum]|uniref:Transposon ty3-I gag-pol polyprotein n=1 Tax=Tanacetum coccineum TaxID=301880 RepID=A0ABQ5E325_9ASTR